MQYQPIEQSSQNSAKYNKIFSYFFNFEKNAKKKNFEFMYSGQTWERGSLTLFPESLFFGTYYKTDSFF